MNKNEYEKILRCKHGVRVLYSINIKQKLLINYNFKNYMFEKFTIQINTGKVIGSKYKKYGITDIIKSKNKTA